MFDIDKYLENISLKDAQPSDKLIDNTIRACINAKNDHNAVLPRKAHLFAAAALCLLTVLLLCVHALIPSIGPTASCYLTIDINPSLCISVDENGCVMGIEAQNDAGKHLINQLSYQGKPVLETIKDIIMIAKNNSMLSEEELQYFLIGHFGNRVDDLIPQLPGLQALLDSTFGNTVDLLIVSGSVDDKQSADQQHISAGLFMLGRMVQGVKVNAGDSVGDIFDRIQKINKDNLCAPVLSLAVDEKRTRLDWTPLDFSAMGYTGKVIYQLLESDSLSDIQNMQADIIETYSFQSSGSQTLSHMLDTGSEGKYYAIAVRYGSSGCTVLSNIVRNISHTAVPASAVPTQEPESTPQPVQLRVTGKISGDKVVISWDKDASPLLTGYKVVASRSNENPRYPEDGHIKTVNNTDTTRAAFRAGGSGLKAGKYYYFSVTYIYSDGTTASGNAVRLKVPEKEPVLTDTQPKEPEPTETPGEEYTASKISGKMSGSNAKLSWTKASKTGFSGYKVVHSFSSKKPKYPDDGYIKYYTDINKLSCTIDVTELDGYTPDAACYFSITVLYNDQSIKKAGNAVKLTMPDAPQYEGTNVSASLSGKKVNLIWDKVNADGFLFYKVVYSFNNETPKYPKNIMLACIPNRKITSFTLKDFTRLLGYEPEKTCHFAVTVCYRDGTRITDNAAHVTYSEP